MARDISPDHCANFVQCPDMKSGRETGMAKVIGLGGVFFHCADVDATRAWYQRVLGLEIDDYGGASFAHAASAAQFSMALSSQRWSPGEPESYVSKGLRVGLLRFCRHLVTLMS